MSHYFILSVVFFSFAPSCAPEPIPPILKELLESATRHRLPMPPKDARLVLAHTGAFAEVTHRGHKVLAPVYSPAFLLERKTDGTIIILRGLDRETLKPAVLGKGGRLIREFAFESAPDIGASSSRYRTDFSFPSTLVCAVQVAAQGDVTTAQELLRLFAEKQGMDGSIPPRVASALFARCIADHLEHRVLQGPDNWRDVHRRLRAVFNDFPDLDAGERRELFDDLSATLSATPAPCGSVEALLLDWAGRPTGSIDDLLPDWAAKPTEPVAAEMLFASASDISVVSARKIVVSGFASVPDLLRLLDDKRVTAHDRDVGVVLRVGDLAEELLQEISATPVELDDVTHLRVRHSPEFWRAWWEIARSKRECDYFAKVVFREKAGRIVNINTAAAHIIARKFPSLLPTLCAKFVQMADSDTDPSGLAHSVESANLPPRDCIKLLIGLIQGLPLKLRASVLPSLTKLDDEEYNKQLLSTLKQLPQDADGPYRAYTETILAPIVMKSGNDRVWREYVRIARESHVGLRIEMLGQSGVLHTGNRTRQLALLSEFLDDKETRSLSDCPKKYDEWSMAYNFSTITIRDFVTMRIAESLDMGETPDPSWDKAMWAKLRNKVRRKLAEEQVPEHGLGN